MFLCNECKRRFDEPRRGTFGDECPKCGSGDYCETGLCQNCGEHEDKQYLKDHNDRCRECVAAFRKRYDGTKILVITTNKILAPK